jgi:hypothetical protein
VTRSRGIALPMVMFVLTALGVLSSLSLLDALGAWRAAQLAAGAVAAKAAVLQGVEHLRSPRDVAWLCLASPATPRREVRSLDDGSELRLTWWSLGGGRVRGEVSAVGRIGGRHRVLAALRADSMPEGPDAIGCPGATGLEPDGVRWLMPHPGG